MQSKSDKNSTPTSRFTHVYHSLPDIHISVELNYDDRDKYQSNIKKKSVFFFNNLTCSSPNLGSFYFEKENDLIIYHLNKLNHGICCDSYRTK